jgi:hypothetical protein
MQISIANIIGGNYIKRIIASLWGTATKKNWGETTSEVWG